MSEPLFQGLPATAPWDYAQLRAHIAEHGILIPVIHDEHENILDGHNRTKIAEELGIEVPVRVEAGLTDLQKWDRYGYGLNVPRRHLSPRERRAMLKEHIRRHPELSDREAARQIGVDDKTAGSVRAELEASAEIPHIRHPNTRADYRNRPETAEARRIFADDEDDARTPLDAADHRNDNWVEITIGYSCPADEVRSRKSGNQYPDGLVYVRETERKEWPSGQMDLKHHGLTTEADIDALCDEIRQRLRDELRRRPLLTMDRELAAWR